MSTRIATINMALFTQYYFKKFKQIMMKCSDLRLLGTRKYKLYINVCMYVCINFSNLFQ